MPTHQFLEATEPMTLARRTLMVMTFAGFLCSQHSPGQEQRWFQSYRAGYRDSQGHWAGGSEIMHLVAHDRRLFAANGYWMDSHWEIPPDHRKQSAQVLRLDRADGQWKVDLELKANRHSLRFMKGNILKAVTFSRTMGGRHLADPVRKLVMAAGATYPRGGAVCVWVRDDHTGVWHHEVVAQGSSLGGVRYVPRDLHVHRDLVTGEERLFLLLGNPGILTGVYDPQRPSGIRWSRNPEYPFPQAGSLRTRPLGIAEANGVLYFSEGSTILQRNDGARPGYTKIVDLNSDTDTDVGGIRGLTAVPAPDGTRQSLLFVWAPGNRSRSQVKRLDLFPDGTHAVSDECSLSDLMSERLGAKVTYTLGAHNMMYPVRDPGSGELVHLIGFQGRPVWSDPSKQRTHLWKNRLYNGAQFAIRDSERRYRVREVNETWQHGFPQLVSPRAFCLSPFGKGNLFIGGHDSSNAVSDNCAWIFRAPLEVSLGVRQGVSVSLEGNTPLPNPRLRKGPLFELRVYRAKEDRFEHLQERFRKHTDHIFRQHGLNAVGYWIAEDQQTHRRTMVYLLKHPSRYQGWLNWKDFQNDKSWQQVLQTPRYQGLLRDPPESTFLQADRPPELRRVDPKEATGRYEIVRLRAAQGRLKPVLGKLNQDGQSLLNKYGLQLLGAWSAFDEPESSTEIVLLLRHEKNGATSFHNIPRGAAWQELFADRTGQWLIDSPTSMVLQSLDFSPLK